MQENYDIHVQVLVAGSLDRRGMHWLSWEKMAISIFKGGMGFRDLEVFNDAMLAKQAWRLMENPDSLCARVFRGRYYADGNFLQAGCSHSSSPTSRAIIKGRDALKEGLIRRIGDGQTTEIWHDRWISGTTMMKPICQLSDNPVQLVAYLIEEDTGAWNEILIREVFTPSDASAIRNMPRSRTTREDIWSWAWEKSRIFTASSSYRGMKEKLHGNSVQPSSSSGGADTWKAMWKLRVQPKIRVFWW